MKINILLTNRKAIKGRNIKQRERNVTYTLGFGRKYAGNFSFSISKYFIV